MGQREHPGQRWGARGTRQQNMANLVEVNRSWREALGANVEKKPKKKRQRRAAEASIPRAMGSSEGSLSKGSHKIKGLFRKNNLKAI